jgi:hypothetical protein
VLKTKEGFSGKSWDDVFLVSSERFCRRCRVAKLTGVCNVPAHTKLKECIV